MLQQARLLLIYTRFLVMYWITASPRVCVATSVLCMLAGAMQRGADAVGNIAGQIFGKAAQYTSDWYSKKIAKSGSVSTLSVEGDAVDGAPGSLSCTFRVFHRHCNNNNKNIELLVLADLRCPVHICIIRGLYIMHSTSVHPHSVVCMQRLCQRAVLR